MDSFLVKFFSMLVFRTIAHTSQIGKLHDEKAAKRSSFTQWRPLPFNFLISLKKSLLYFLHLASQISFRYTDFFVARLPANPSLPFCSRNFLGKLNQIWQLSNDKMLNGVEIAVLPETQCHISCAFACRFVSLPFGPSSFKIFNFSYFVVALFIGSSKATLQCVYSNFILPFKYFSVSIAALHFRLWLYVLINS